MKHVIMKHKKKIKWALKWQNTSVFQQKDFQRVKLWHFHSVYPSISDQVDDLAQPANQMTADSADFASNLLISPNDSHASPRYCPTTHNLSIWMERIAYSD